MKAAMKENSNAKQHLVLYLLPILIMVFIFIQSSLPADLSKEESSFFVEMICRWISADEELVSFIVRKCAHFAEYLLLGASLLAALSQRMRRTAQRAPSPTGPRALPPAWLLSWLIGAAYAVSDEIHQMFVPGRSCEIRDILIDSAGVACGVLICRLFLIRRKLLNNAS